MAVFLLGGGRRPVDTEDVAVRAFKLSPARFAWRKYPNQINLELIRVALSDAKKAKNGRLLNGAGDKGWSLTPTGLELASSTARTIPKMELRGRTGGVRNRGGVQARHKARERNRLLRTRAWRMWSSGGRRVAIREAEAVFRIDDYADARLRALKITRMRVLFAEDGRIERFLKRMSTILGYGER